MVISIPDPVYQTKIFTAFFLVLLFFSVRKKILPGFNRTVTEELKGFAILAVVFSHIGYFLSSDHSFLFPLSILAGVGVNLFLFLSGYGLSLSSKQTTFSPLQFYKRRLPKLLIPLWVILLAFLVLDYFLLGKTYPPGLTILNFFGFFPSAQIYQVIDSPLWYFSLILFFYLIFPWLFRPDKTALSAFLMLLAAFLTLRINLPIDSGVLNLYKVHFIAFSLGVACSSLRLSFLERVKKYNLLLLIPLLLLFFYTAINSGVGSNKFIEQSVSLITTSSVLLIFAVSNLQLRLFNLLGKYSYEIYLIHWPILYRYGFLYKMMPAAFATLLYLMLFILLAALLQGTVKRVLKLP